MFLIFSCTNYQYTHTEDTTEEGNAVQKLHYVLTAKLDYVASKLAQATSATEIGEWCVCAQHISKTIAAMHVANA